MEFVLTLLVLVIVIILPLVVVLLGVVGLIYGINRALRGEKKSTAPPVDSHLYTGPAKENKPMPDEVVPLNGNKNG